MGVPAKKWFESREAYRERLRASGYSAVQADGAAYGVYSGPSSSSSGCSGSSSSSDGGSCGGGE